MTRTHTETKLETDIRSKARAEGIPEYLINEYLDYSIDQADTAEHEAIHEYLRDIHKGRSGTTYQTNYNEYIELAVSSIINAIDDNV